MGNIREPSLQEALLLARTGDKGRAREMLIEILKQDRDNFDAWVVIAQVAENQQEALTCIKQALRLRPDDERAKRFLEHLLRAEDVAPPATKEKKRASPWLWLGVGVALVALLVVAGFLVMSRLSPGSQVASLLSTPLAGDIAVPVDIGAVRMNPGLPTILPTVTLTLTATQTFTPSVTPSPTSTTPPPTATGAPTQAPTATAATPLAATTEPAADGAPTTGAPTAGAPADMAENLADPCSPFTFGTITRNADGKGIDIAISNPGGATLTNLLVAWSMGGGLDKIKHGNGFIPNTSASGPPGIFPLSEKIGSGDSLELLFTTAVNDPPAGITVILTFVGGCTKPIVN